MTEIEELRNLAKNAILSLTDEEVEMVIKILTSEASSQEKESLSV